MSDRQPEQRGGEWSVELDPPVLLPSRPVRVHVRHVPDRDREARGEDHVERTVDVLQVSGIEHRRIGRFLEQRRRFDRETHVIETHRFYERDVLCRRVRFEMRFRVIGRLRKPVTQIDSAP